NFPDGDTVMLDEEGRVRQDDYYTYARFIPREQLLVNGFEHRPVDKTDNYIKRCVAVPGDVVEIRSGMLHVNGQPAPAFPHLKHEYSVVTKGSGLSDETVEAAGINTAPDKDIRQGPPTATMNLLLENGRVDAVRRAPEVASVSLSTDGAGWVGGPLDWTFPHDTLHYKWNKDNYGPLTIPKKGMTVTLTPENFAIYQRIISTYEGNKLEVRDGQYFINDQPATTYTM